MSNYYGDGHEYLRDNFIASAKNKYKDLFDISIFKVSGVKNVDIGILGDILSSLQNIIYSLSLSPESRANFVHEKRKTDCNLFFHEFFENPLTIRCIPSKKNSFENGQMDLFDGNHIDLV